MRYARLMGLNAIDTYIPWNLHEPFPGEFRFSGILDLRHFLEIAHELGFLVILRPGPYICAEWDLGGIPPYLLAVRNMHLRSTHPVFLNAMKRYFDNIATQILPYIGKPIVAIQIENEYGAYGSEKAYLEAILEEWQRQSLSRSNVMFFTADNGGLDTVRNGSQFDSSKVLKAVNLDWNVMPKVAMLRRVQPTAPALIAEFWTGWFDHWGEKHNVRSGEDVVKIIRQTLFEAEASINVYMFFGGTNFGFMSGANIADKSMEYQPTTTSYDYDAFITEYGDLRRSKFDPVQSLLREFWKSIGNIEMAQATLQERPKPPLMSAYAGTVPLVESVQLYEVLDSISDSRKASKYPLTMEEAGGDYGFVMYRHSITSPSKASDKRVLRVFGVRDFAYVLADQVMIETIDRNQQLEADGHTIKEVLIPSNTKQLDVLVENRGRVNYGPYIHDRKGILGNITLDGIILQDFETILMSFPQDHPLLPDTRARGVIDQLRRTLSGRNDHPPLGARGSPPTFFRGEMYIDPGSKDAFSGEYPGTHCRVFGRGVLWVNGFNVGRFHTGVPGPQRSLFVPGALLRAGRNEFIVLHMNMQLTTDPPNLRIFEQPDLGISR